MVHWPRTAALVSRVALGEEAAARLQAGGHLSKATPVDHCQDNHPLASLPLLGYSLTIPSESEDIHKDHVFKLHFKSHVYYFRAESEYTFER